MRNTPPPSQARRPVHSNPTIDLRQHPPRPRLGRCRSTPTPVTGWGAALALPERGASWLALTRLLGVGVPGPEGQSPNNFHLLRGLWMRPSRGAPAGGSVCEELLTGRRGCSSQGPSLTTEAEAETHPRAAARSRVLAEGSRAPRILCRARAAPGGPGREGRLCPRAAQPEATGAENPRPAGRAEERQVTGRGPALRLRSSPPPPAQPQVSREPQQGS